MVQHINNVVKIAGQAIDRATLTGLKTASLKSGVSFQYLVAKAAQESSLKTDAEATTSSAKGLFQFTRGTWLDMMKRYGALYGYGDLAQKISIDDNGRAKVNDTATEQRILALRGNPEASALMAAEYARDNAEVMHDTLGRDADASDLYLAHFLGPNGAGQLITAALDSSSASAASVLPAAAKANRAVFYTPEGRARSAGEVVELVRERFAGQMDRYAEVASAMGVQSAPVTAQAERRAPAAPPAFDFRVATTNQDQQKAMVNQFILQEMAKLISQAPMNMMDGFEDAQESAEDNLVSSTGYQGNDWGNVLASTYAKSFEERTPDPNAARARATETYDMLNAVPAVPVAPPRRRDDT